MKLTPLFLIVLAGIVASLHVATAQQQQQPQTRGGRSADENAHAAAYGKRRDARSAAADSNRNGYNTGNGSQDEERRRPDRRGYGDGRHERSLDMTRERILEHHESRKGHLEKLIEETKQKVADHDSGDNPSEDIDLHRRRVDLYSKKLEKMQQPPDEHEIQRTMERENHRREAMMKHRFRSEF
eukprot:CAMPEP_0119549114 /NCGR_PEP_ID=MMETSP1352-20130426/2896_1 /TAXON_ID=265584 /ORGANISM="Stauroneis constricta, Strain CCMP1120" /LENGTH=183 /DNA_ID=CAMNT_0007594583 /DNA_START=37 /DNA_END=588 /DNA_ORIENTATION=-